MTYFNLIFLYFAFEHVFRRRMSARNSKQAVFVNYHLDTKYDIILLTGGFAESLITFEKNSKIITTKNHAEVNAKRL